MPDIRWVDYIVNALKNLGGIGDLEQIYEQILLIRKEPFAETWQGTVRWTIQTHSSDSEIFNPNGEDLFYSVEGLNMGVWGLRI